MYHFEYKKKDGLLLSQVKPNYQWLFSQGLSEESILVRFFLLEFLHQEYGYTGKICTNNNQPQPIRIGGKTIHWSISHSQNYIAFIIGSTKVAIDITEMYPRSSELLCIHSDKEYSSMGIGKTWEAFYTLWAAKEVVIKLENITLDNIRKIKLKEIIDDAMIMTYNCNIYKVNTLKRKEIILAYGNLVKS